MTSLTSTPLLDLRERITSRGRVCSISEVATGEEEGRQQECHNRTRHVVNLLDAFLYVNYPDQTRITSPFCSH